MITPFTLPTHFKPVSRTFAAQTPALPTFNKALPRPFLTPTVACLHRGSKEALNKAPNGAPKLRQEVSPFNPLNADAVQFGMTTAEEGDLSEEALRAAARQALKIPLQREMYEAALIESVMGRARQEAQSLRVLIRKVVAYYDTPRDPATLAEAVNEEVRARVYSGEFSKLIPDFILHADKPGEITERFRQALEMAFPDERERPVLPEDFDLFDRESLHAAIKPKDIDPLWLAAYHFNPLFDTLLATPEYRKRLELSDENLEAFVAERLRERMQRN